MTPAHPERILTQADLAVKDFQRSVIWKAALEDASVERSPLLVHSLAPPADGGAVPPAAWRDYYIVSIVRANGASARFAYDADTVELLEAVGVSKSGETFRPYVDAWSVVRSRLSNAESAPPDSADVVWMPCRESTSRFAPFWRFNVQGQTVYVRSDGELYRALTTSGRG